MYRNFEKEMLKLIQNVKDTVERNARLCKGIWHSALFDSSLLRNRIGFFVYGSAYPSGFVFINTDSRRIVAFDKDMIIINNWEIK